MPRKNSTTQVQGTEETAPGNSERLPPGDGTKVRKAPARGGAQPQARIDATSADAAWEEYKDLAGDYAKKAQTWADAQELRDVRLEDLVKVHAHRPFDNESAARVAREAAKAVQQEKDALGNKQAAKKALDAAWATVRNFEGETTVRPLIPDDDPE